MAEIELSRDQVELLSIVPDDRLVLVQFVGCTKNAQLNAPSPSGVLVDEFGFTQGNYGLAKYHQLLYVLAEDAAYKRWYRKSTAKVELPDDAPKAAAKKSTIKKESQPNQIKVKRD